MKKVYCRVNAELRVDSKLMWSRLWEQVDIMHTGGTRGVARRKFNEWLKDLGPGCLIGKDKVITMYWEAFYGPPNYTRITGALSGVNGRTMRMDGMFERK